MTSVHFYFVLTRKVTNIVEEYPVIAKTTIQFCRDAYKVRVINCAVVLAEGGTSALKIRG